MKAEFTIKNYRCFSDQEPLRFTLEEGFTAFVGPNNSGKSSILKFFFEFRELWRSLSSEGGSYLASLREQVPLNLIGVLDRDEVFCDLSDGDLEIDLSFQPEESTPSGIEPVKRFKISIPRSGPIWSSEVWVGSAKVGTKGLGLGSHRNVLLVNNRRMADFSRVFTFFKSLISVMYIPSFRNAINVGGSGTYYDIDVGADFIGRWHEWKTGATKACKIAVLRVSQDIKRVFGYRELEITASKELNTLQIVADGKSYRLGELGGGLTQFIVVLGNAVLKNPSFILIDEPELNLHPSLQMDFLTTLGSYSKHRVVFATHSLGLARAGANRVYCVREENGKNPVRPLEDTPRLSEFLGELSFGGYKELGCDKVLLVEGVNDVKPIQQFLRFLRKEHKILLLPLGGAQMINGRREGELAEITRVTENISALIDSERLKKGEKLDKNRQAFLDVCNKLGIEAQALERRAIENYLTEEAVQRAKSAKYHALTPYEKLEESDLPWAKHENWHIAREMKFEDIENTDLGTFLKAL